MKKMLSLIMVLILCTTMMTVTVYAAEGGSMSVSSATAAPGEAVTVEVAITGNPGVAALVVVPTFDSSVLTLNSITGSGLAWTTGNAAAWSDAANTTYTGTILTLNFTVNSSAAYGSTPVGVSVDAANFDEELVSFTVTEGTVTIAKPECSHVWDAGTVTTPAGCETTGVKTYTCTVSGCGETRTEEIPATGHSYGEWTVVEGPTCTEKGTETRTCVCGAEETREVAAAGHALNSMKSDADGHWYVCDNCEYTSEKQAHSFDGNGNCACGSQKPAENPPENPPVDDPPAEDTPTEDTPTEDTPVEDTPEETTPDTPVLDNVPKTGDINHGVAVPAVMILGMAAVALGLGWKRKASR